MSMLRYCKALGLCLAALLQIQLIHAQERSPSVAPEAEEIIRQMSDFLADQNTFTFEAEILYENVYTGFEGGLDVPAEKTSSIRHVTSTVSRPDKFRVSIKEDPQVLEFVFDGKMLALHDLAAKVFVKKAFIGSTDDVLALLRKTYQSDPPLSDLLESNLYGTHMDGVTFASYLGVTRLRGYDVHQVAFASEGMDWQVWIKTGDEPVPVLLQILARDQAYWPYFQAWFTTWEVGMNVAEEVFVFQEPDDSFATQFVEDTSLAE